MLYLVDLRRAAALQPDARRRRPSRCSSASRSLSAVLAVAQDSLALAVLGASGGFLAPILASTGRRQPRALFSYYAVLNAGILAIAWFKAWRSLNLVGFAFTFVIGTAGASASTGPSTSPRTEPFLVAVLPPLRRDPAPVRAPPGRTASTRYVDATLVFGVPLVAFGLQVGLVHAHRVRRGVERARAGGALSRCSRGRLGRARGERLRLLAEAFLALGVVFAHAGDPAGTRRPLDLGRVGARGRGDRLGRRAPAAAAGAALRPRAAVPRRRSRSSTIRRGRSARRRSRTAPISAASSSRSRGLFCAWYLDRHARGGHRAASGSPLASCSRGASLWWVVGGLHEIDQHVRHGLSHAGRAPLPHRARARLFSWLHTRSTGALAR